MYFGMNYMSSNTTTDPKVKEWIEKISQAAGGEIDWLIQTGAALTQAKADLPFGKWGLLFSPGGLKFGQRRAEMFMQIFRCPALKDPKNFSDLPPHWSILYALCQLPVEVLMELIASSQIHPEMTLREARELAKARHPVEVDNAPALKRAGKKIDFDKRLARLTAHLEREAALWPPPFRADLVVRLREVAQAIEKDCL